MRASETCDFVALGSTVALQERRLALHPGEGVSAAGATQINGKDTHAGKLQVIAK